MSYPSQGGGGGGSVVIPKTIIKALADPQLNRSSVGDTYVDVAGNTYAETTHQTRVTSNALYKRYIVMKISGHVSAGTGTFALYNQTTGATYGTVTTSSASEVALAATNTTNQTQNLGDVYTIKVKNSNAGESITIDDGGLVEADSVTEVTTNNKWVVNAALPYWISRWKVATLTGLSTTSVTLQPTGGNNGGGAVFNLPFNIGASYTELNTIREITVPYKLTNSNMAALGVVTSSISGQLLIAYAYECTVFDL